MKIKNLFSNRKKVIIFISTIVLVLFIVSVSGYKCYAYVRYNNILSSANKDMDNGNYSKAIDLFKQSLNYKNDEDVHRSITLANKLEQIQNYYNQGLKLMSNKKYLDAINSFNDVTNDDNNKIYSNAQSKIKDCKSDFITQTMQQANSAYQNRDYNSANNYINEILKIDSNNIGASNLKSLIVLSQNQSQQATTITAQVKNTQNQQNRSTASAINNSTNQQVSSSSQKQGSVGQVQATAQQNNNQHTATGTNQTSGNNVPNYNSGGNTTSNGSSSSNTALLASLKQQEAQAQQQVQSAENNKDVRVYENGQWQWEADQTAVQQAQNRLYQIEAEINALQ